MKKKNGSALETQLKILLGRMINNGATEEEIQIIIQAVYLTRRYLPFYKALKES